MNRFKTILLIFITIWVIILLAFIGIDLGFDESIKWYENIVLAGISSIFPTITVCIHLNK